VFGRCNSTLAGLRDEIVERTLKGHDAYVIVYSITSNTSFEEVDLWVKRIHRLKGEDALVWLVGNKCDLGDDREVSSQRGQDLARQLGCEFSETSAKTGENVEHTFMSLAQTLYKRKSARRKGQKKKKKYLHCSIM
jgi:GTPase SAR1 family protein